MRKYLFLLSMVLAVFTVSLPATAADYIGQAEAGLKQNHVYIASTVQGTTVSTAGLKASLTSGDNIVLVMLPKEALGSIDASNPAAVQQVLQQDATSLDHDLGASHYIIGLSIGDATIGYSTQPNMDAAADLMNRAESATANPYDTLRAYAQYVHGWQSQHPQAKTTTAQQKAAHHNSVSPAVFVPSAAILAALLVVVVGRALRSSGPSGTSTDEHIKLHAPDQVRDRLRQILNMRSQVNSPTLQDKLTQTCKDVESYFDRLKRSGKVDTADTDMFRRHLDNVQSVLVRYIDVQNNPRFYDDPQDLLRRGQEAINSFGDFVLSSIRRGSRTATTDFRVNTDILSAARYTA